MQRADLAVRKTKILTSGIKYRDDKEHAETCSFLVKSNDNKFEVGPCGQKAIGEFKKSPLCQEHFEYQISLHGVSYLTEVER